MRGVLFDLDETLVDRSGSIAQYAHRFYLEFQSVLPFTDTEFVATFIRLDGNGYLSRPEFFAALAAAIAHPALGIERIQQHFQDNVWQQPLLVPGALDGIAALKRQQIPVGLVTNGGSVNQSRKITNSGLADLLDHWVISETFGSKKPDPRIFLSAAGKLGIDPNQSWFVGDHPLLDICGADDAGFQTIWLERSISWPEDKVPSYTHGPCSLAQAFSILQRELGQTQP